MEKQHAGHDSYDRNEKRIGGHLARFSRTDQSKENKPADRNDENRDEQQAYDVRRAPDDGGPALQRGARPRHKQPADD